MSGGELFKRLALIQGEIAKEGMAKTQTGMGYKFRGIDDVYNMLASKLAKHGVTIFPRVLERDETVREAKSGNALYHVAVLVEYTLVCSEDGSTHTGVMAGEAMDAGDKATNKAMSAAYKYFWFQTLCIPTEGDNDADSTTHPETAPAGKPKSTTEAWVETALAEINEFNDDADFAAWQEKTGKILIALKKKSAEGAKKIDVALASKTAELLKNKKDEA